ncbi:signal peptidase I Serine peptidase. MEROPS family S26A [Colwellia chukchiensis]|uniref:Signal peptidase I n=1 Tax=Colwellia chukchiensis TaxID=641665 RepID=A0A1H7G0F7_9GAMM|nr:signal peptidase I [Colwellia chukchiensis]SEK30997.1 signal peptidase I Serine peptidase. MEROPS family S26A [Colwellia chukchiensis]
MKNAISHHLKANKSLLVFISLMLVFRSAIADWNDVPTGSMKPTIVEGDRILINKLAYDLKLPFSQHVLIPLNEPQRHDIVIFQSRAADKRLVKRVIAVPGDTVALINNQLFINQQLAQYKIVAKYPNYVLSEESFAGKRHLIRTQQAPGVVSTSALANFKSITIPDNSYLVMGDNRDHSADSRVIGLVPRHEIIGRSTRVAFSLNYQQYFMPRSERFFKTI